MRRGCECRIFHPKNTKNVKDPQRSELRFFASFGLKNAAGAGGKFLSRHPDENFVLNFP